MAADEIREPSLESLLEMHREVMLDGVRVMLPGVILSYNETTQKAVVQPLIKHRHVDEEGNEVPEDLPAIHECPVVFCGNARGRITWPVAAGDTCEIRFASSSIARWAQVGGSVDPGDDRHHDLSDAVCFVGLHDFSNVPTDAPTDAIVLHANDGTTIKLGSSGAADPVALKSDLDAFVGGLDARIVFLTGGLPGTAAELAIIQAVRDALPLGFPTCAQKVTAE
jgi:Phage protein Gp138 N-terminal domain